MDKEKKEYLEKCKEILHEYKRDGDYIEVKVPDAKVEKIKKFVKEVIERKREEPLHNIDGDSEYQRFYSGTLGEAAIEELLNVDIIDWNKGDSREFNYADLRSIGLDIGIKTVNYGSCHLINRYVKRPEILIFKVNDNTVIICGIASVEVLKNNQRDDLMYGSVKNKLDRYGRTTKVGFDGYKYIENIKSLQDLKIYNSKNII